MMDTLTAAFCDIMHKYRKAFTIEGVRANLVTWQTSKSDLLTLLRRHPDWNEQELAIIFRFTEGRDIDHDVVDECRFEMLELAGEAEMTAEQRTDFAAALAAATADYSKTPSEENLVAIRAHGKIKCATGQKASRIINKLCGRFGVDRLPRYNSVFARLADSLNPVIIQKTGVLSIHPCDFLEMSNRDDAWSSCHCLAHGGWQAGCLSYMGDSVSMVFFTVDEDVTEQFHKVPRITREIFCFNEGTLLQSRLYPSDDNDQRSLHRSLIQKAIADCLGVPNLWSTMKQLDETRDYMLTTTGSTHYTDYYNGYAILSLLKGADEHGTLQIGSHAICTCCGRPLSSRSSLQCSSCESMVVCKECGEAIPMDNAQYADGAWYCRACLHICGFCGHVTHGELHPAFNGRGLEIQVCAHCLEVLQTPCGACSVRGICEIIQGTRFCIRTTNVASVPVRAA